MNTTPKPTWMTLFSLSAIFVAAFFLIVPLVRSEPVVGAIFILLIAVGLFDVIALWIMANREALEREFLPRNQKHTPYRYYGRSHQPISVKQGQQTSKTSDMDSNDQ